MVEVGGTGNPKTFMDSQQNLRNCTREFFLLIPLQRNNFFFLILLHEFFLLVCVREKIKIYKYINNVLDDFYRIYLIFWVFFRIVFLIFA